MIFHVLNAAHKKTHSILADDFRTTQSATPAEGNKAAVLHTVIEFITRDTVSHWLRADVVTEAVVARVKTTKDYTVIAVSAIEQKPIVYKAGTTIRMEQQP